VEVFDHPDHMRAWSCARRAGGASIAVVPTMGALHDGHLALVDEARLHADVVIVTIFVNPLQFNQPTDFDAYPRPIDDDLTMCESVGVDAVYAPTSATMYPAGFQTHVEPGTLADRLEGSMRPGHFRGVTTVVTKLFGATAPDVAVFGQKDYQQLAIVRRMVADLDLGIVIVGLATRRESDGLARSSRNVRLTADDRAAAVVIPRALELAHARYDAGERNADALRRIVTDTIAAEPRARLEDVAIVDASTLEPVEQVGASSVVLVRSAPVGWSRRGSARCA
jgi:pantoate--beta-alanine ligase